MVLDPAGGPLIHTPKLLRVKDAWLTALPEGHLTDVMAVMRRAFDGWAPPERQALASKVRPLDQIDGPAEEELEVTEVAAVLAAVDSSIRLGP